MRIATASAGAAEAPTYEDLIARGHALVPHFAERAARCEADCRVSDETVERFRETGLHKTLLPAAYGGYEMGFSALLETSFSIGKVCASSAWVCGLYMVHNWFGGLFPKEAQDEMWGQDSGRLHLRLLCTNRQSDSGRRRLSALGAISVLQRVARGRMESLRREVADRARGPAGAGLHPGPKGRLQDRLGKLASCGPCRNRKL